MNEHAKWFWRMSAFERAERAMIRHERALRQDDAAFKNWFKRIVGGVGIAWLGFKYAMQELDDSK